jgi:hypothetical protein
MFATNLAVSLFIRIFVTTMNELARHIASLLLENDCVIIPNFGGFIAHYIPAQLLDAENVFLPPTRVIGFNPQLRINDGLLAQSYMSVYGSSFPDAVKMIQQQSDELTSIIHETGYMELDNVGELRYNIHGKYEFTPFDHRIATPAIYGLDSFKMKELKDLLVEEVPVAKPVQKETNAPVTVQEPKMTTLPSGNAEKHATSINEQGAKIVDFSKYLRNIAAVAAVIVIAVISYFIASPLDNTVKSNEASVLSNDVLKESMSMSSIVTHQPTTKEATTTENQSEDNTSANATSAPFDTTKPGATTITQKLYNVIVASVGDPDLAQKEAQRLIQQGYPQAKAIIGDGKARVSVASFEVETDAYRAIRVFQSKGQFDQAWVLRK